MGTFDYLRCKYPLPLAGANALTFQTKNTPAQFLDTYELREDGTLWHEAYDTEDHSDLALFRAWYDATWTGSGTPGRPIPQSGDPHYTEYLDGYMLALGAWSGATRVVRGRRARAVKGA